VGGACGVVASNPSLTSPTSSLTPAIMPMLTFRPPSRPPMGGKIIFDSLILPDPMVMVVIVKHCLENFKLILVHRYLETVRGSGRQRKTTAAYL
jgi:hypothetical protein